MEYERIHKVQNGIISPSKLRMKLMGAINQKEKDGSKSNSARTSPSKAGDSDFVKNNLLAAKDGDFDEEGTGVVVNSGQVVQLSSQPTESLPRENADPSRAKAHQFSRGDNGNMSSIHPLRVLEDENLDYDSNASSSCFEFHKGERAMHNHISRSFSRTMPSKWNDAEKWIMNRHNGQAHYNSRKNHMHNQANRMPMTSIVRVAPESASTDKLAANRVAETKRIDFCQPMSRMESEKFSFAHGQSHRDGNDPQTKDLQEVDQPESSCTTEDSSGPAIRAVCMRDMGTEMTPIASQDPSRTSTPLGATTPLRSPTSSIPSTPRRGGHAPSSVDFTTDEESRQKDGRKKELSEEELKLKTRREIVALGVQLGKMNIAAWASKEEKEKNSSAETDNFAEMDRVEFERRAAAWEEAEKSKHTARYKRKEIKIQAWESQQKAKLEAEMRRIEAQVEQLRAQAQAKMVKKIAMARQRSEVKRSRAEAEKIQQAERTAAQAEYIRQTGQIPSSPFTCCGWS